MRRGEPAVRALDVLVPVGLLARDPVSEMAVGQRLERAATLAVRTGEAVVVHQRVETVAAAIPDVPDEGTLVEELAVLLEETVAQPCLDGFGGRAISRRGG